jgi:iron complex outermembrane receptor protein
LNNYSGWESTGGLFSTGDASDAASYSGALLVDAEVSATFAEHYTIAIGAENLFDEVPGNEADGTLNVLGVSKSITSPYGFNGGFYYLRGMISF